MPTPGPIVINKAALNALVDLYYLYGDMVTHAIHTNESAQELDVFYLQGGLRLLLKKYHEESALDPVAAGDVEGPLTIERLLPRPTISAVAGIEAEKVSQLRGLLKNYFDGFENIYGTPIPQDAEIVIRQGREILANRIKRSRSTSIAAEVDLASALVRYEDQVLKIGSIEIKIRLKTLEDYVLKYMYQHCNKGESVNRDTLASWAEEQSIEREVTSKAVYDKCTYINKKVQENLGTTLNLFDTSEDNKIKRNY